MASLPTDISSTHLDNRSESRAYKRDKDHSVKWSHGTRPSPGVKPLYQLGNSLDGPMMGGSEAQQAKVRPALYFKVFKHRHNFNSSSSYDEGFATNRIARKHDALREINTTPSLSRSLSDLPSPADSAPAVDADVLYSFDAAATPHRALGLDGLVEKAELEWQSRETDKMVRNEYEMLDESGEEVKVQPKGKGKGRKGSNSPRQPAVPAVLVHDEDDWETI